MSDKPDDELRLARLCGIALTFANDDVGMVGARGAKLAERTTP